MPVPVETLWSMKKLNVIFAATALLMLATMLWMMWHDHDRKWRHMQTDYFDLRSAMSHLTVLAFDSPEEQARFKQLEEAVARAEASLDSKEVEAARSEVKRLGGLKLAVALAYGNLNAEIQVTAFLVEEHVTLHGADDPRTEAAQAKYSEQMVELVRLKADQDEVLDDLAAAQAALKAMEKGVTAARKARDQYVKQKSDAERDYALYGKGITRSIFNLVGFDYLTPKATPGRQEVRQVYMPDIRFNFNYLDSYQTDRCITCHVGIDNPDMTRENFVRQGEKALQSAAVREVMARRTPEYLKALRGRLADVRKEVTNEGLAQMDEKDRQTFVRSVLRESNVYVESIERPAVESTAGSSEEPRPIATAAADDKSLTRGKLEDLIEGRVAEILGARRPRAADSDKRLDYREMDHRQRASYEASVLAVVNDYLEEIGRPRVKLNKVLLAHPKLDLYVDPESAHPMIRMGCTVCHEGSGQETDFILAAHTPRTRQQQHDWERDYGEKAAGFLPLNSFHMVEEFWEHPMFPADYASASCTKCHDRAMDLERHRTERLLTRVPKDNPGTVETALRIVEGRQLFTEVGCINCHNVDGLGDSRRVGPDLARVDEKLNTGFMERWIEYPNDFRPSTRMPHFFRQENNLPSSRNDADPDPILRTETEIQAMTHYLLTFSRSFDPVPLPAGVAGDAGRGEQLFTSIGCLACHANLDAHDPSDDAGRTIGERWIVTELMMADGESAEAAKASYDGMSKNDRVRFAMRRFDSQRREKAKKAALAEELAADSEGRDPDEGMMYVPPVFTLFAPELSGLGTKLIPDADDSAQRQRAMLWLTNWLRDPRHYSVTAKMPSLFQDSYYWKEAPSERPVRRDQDLMDLAAYLLGLRNDDFDVTPIADDAAHQAEARRLIRLLLGGQNTTSVTEKILDDKPAARDERFGRLSAAIVQQTYKSFGGGRAGRQLAEAKFADQSLENRQKLYLGMKMIGHYGCYACHNVTGFEDASRPGTDQSGWGQKYITQLDFAFYSPPFEEEIERQPEVFGKVYPESAEFEHLVRDLGRNPDQEILHNHASFAYHKLMNPRIWDRKKVKRPYDKLKMPNFYFTEEESRALVTYLLSRRDPWVTEAVKVDYDGTPAGKIADGRALVRELNCVGCHAIEADWANLHQYFKDDSSLSDLDPVGKRFMPPLLWGQGAKVQSGWMHRFLGNVEMLRPWHNVRMPSFHLTTDDRTTLVEYFVGLVQDESEVLRGQVAPVLAHIAAARAEVGTDGNEPGEADESIGADWFVDQTLAGEAAFLKDWAVSHTQETPYSFQVEPGAALADRVDSQMTGHQNALRRARFLSDLYDIDYPFPRKVSAPMTDEQYELGRELFFNQKCLSCHVAGDPSAEGTTSDVKAPNFALTYERLRYDWLVGWMQDPQAIQPGANMPQIFQEGSAFSSLAEDQRAELEGKFGKTAEAQMGLLVDFLYALGNRRDTVVQPGGVGEAGGEMGEIEFDFDEEAPASQPTSRPAEVEFDF